MLTQYKTVYNICEKEIIEKKSKFIATVVPILSEEEAQIFLLKMKKKHWNASHNCFAYIVGIDNQIQRLSDDGEPSGTAGIPIMEVLKGQDIKNVLINVTRYFGGTLLGTGGLVRAYGTSAKATLSEATIVDKILYTNFFITIGYTLSGKVQHASLQNNYIIVDTIYTDKVQFSIITPKEDKNRFIKIITEITRGDVEIEEQDSRYETFLKGKLL